MDSTHTDQNATEFQPKMDPVQAAPRIVDFLRALWPGFHQLARIKAAGGAPVCMLVDTEDEHAAGKVQAFLEEDGQWNFYHSANMVRPGLGKKAEKGDIVRAMVLHADIDPPPANEYASLEKMREGMLNRLTDGLPKGVPAPTIIVDSGNGFQGIWVLDQPIAVDGDLERAAEVEAYNAELARRLVADMACANVDRLLRLPYTTNVPNAAKVGKGRTKRWAALLENTGERHTLESFRKADAAKIRRDKRGQIVAEKLPAVEVPADLPVVDVAALPVPDRVKIVIVQGREPDAPPKEPDDSRSAWMFDAVCQLVRRKVDPAAIVSILLDERYAISDHVRDQGASARRYAVRQVARAMAAVKDDDNKGGGADYSLLLGNFKGRVVLYDNIHYEYRDGLYRPIEKEEMAKTIVDNGQPVTPSEFSMMQKLINASTLVPKYGRDAPFWIDGRDDDPMQYLIFTNGMVDMRRPDQLLNLDDNLFTFNRLPVAYDPHAGRPDILFRFLETAVPADAHGLVLQILRDALNPRPGLGHPFIGCLIGGRGTAKSTLSELIIGLAGPENCALPQVSSLSKGDFGQEPWIGKRIIMFNDLDTSGLQNVGTIASIFRQTSANEMQTVNRKGVKQATLRFNARMIMVGNAMPKVPDPQRALARRYRVVDMPYSFEDGTAKVPRDPHMKERLLAAVPSIIKYLIEHVPHGPWEQPESGRRWLEQARTPLNHFIDECCELGPGFHSDKEELLQAWIIFQAKHYQGERHMLALETFGRHLVQAHSTITTDYRPERGGPRRYGGIKLRTRPAPVDDSPLAKADAQFRSHFEEV